MIVPRLERTYRVRFDECGPDGYLPASGYLRYAQDLAWVHSSETGFGRSWYAERGLTWLIRAIDIEILGRAAYGDELLIVTEVLGFRRVWARRRSEVRTGSGQPLAVAFIDWVLLNAAGAPTRVPPEIVDSFPTGRGSFTPLRVQLPSAPGDATWAEFAVRRGELDPMGHVNNAVYLDYIDEHMAATGDGAATDDVSLPARVPRRYRVEYVAAAEPHMTLRAAAWPDGHAWLWQLTSAGERELVRATVAGGFRSAEQDVVVGQ